MYRDFSDDNNGKHNRISVQVKSGHVRRAMIATLKGDMDRENAETGLFFASNRPTRPMTQEAAPAGIYVLEHSPDHRYPRLQILTIEELLNGTQAEYPHFAPDLAPSPLSRPAPSHLTATVALYIT